MTATTNKLGEQLLKILAKLREPSTIVDLTYGRYDLAIKTDEQGRAVMLFMGKRDEKGHVIGNRFARRVKTDADGTIIKDHWEHKGKAIYVPS